MPIIIHITPTTLVAPERAFRKPETAGATLIDAMVLPKPAADVLTIQQGITVRALHHASSATYAFTHNWGAYRAFAPMVLAGLEQSPHWQACKQCHAGQWCKDGAAIIAATMAARGDA